MTNSKICLHHILSWPKWLLELKFHEDGTFDAIGKRKQTNRQDSCFINIDIVDLISAQNIQSEAIFVVCYFLFSDTLDIFKKKVSNKATIQYYPVSWNEKYRDLLKISHHNSFLTTYTIDLYDQSFT